MTVSQFIPMFNVGYKWTFFGPLVVCAGVYMLKEAWDDYKRRKGDKHTNQIVYKVVRLD